MHKAIKICEEKSYKKKRKQSQYLVRDFKSPLSTIDVVTLNTKKPKIWQKDSKSHHQQDLNTLIKDITTKQEGTLSLKHYPQIYCIMFIDQKTQHSNDNNYQKYIKF